LVPVTVSATSLSFAATKVGTTSALKSITITNNQAVAIGLNPGIGGTNAADFAVSAAGTTCATSLAADSSCVYSLAFSPVLKGALSAVLDITDSPDPDSPYLINLSGTGR
jgi:hypothetical protein